MLTMKNQPSLRKKLSRKLRHKIRYLMFPDHIHDHFLGNYPFNLKSLSSFKIKSFGDKNPDKTFFVIWRDNIGSGFFSNLNLFLQHFEFARQFNFIPVIDCENFPTIYNTEKPINNSKNSWQYYFHQVSPYSLEEVYQSKNVIFSTGFLINHSASFELLNNYQPRSPKQIFNDEIKLQDNVINELAKYQHYFDNNSKILGVHIRGKDINTTQHHPFGPTLEQIFRYTDEMLNKYQIDKIFLACEDLDYFNQFTKKYHDKVFFADIYRSSKLNSFNLNPRENHRYLLGLEVLTETLLLSKCSHMLCSSSNIANFAFDIGDFQVRYFIDNGINSSRRYVAKYKFFLKSKLPKNFFGLKDEVKIFEKN